MRKKTRDKMIKITLIVVLLSFLVGFLPSIFLR